jgi:hypothetical protein
MGSVSSSLGSESHDWLGLRWSAWMPLMAAHPLALAQLPAAPGVYRIRRAGGSGGLLWVGWGRRGIREAVERLSRQVHMPVQPYDDPDSPALTLWKKHIHDGMSFEVSGAPLDPTTEDGGPTAHEVIRYMSLAPVPLSDE